MKFQFDEETRAFVKKIKERPFSPPPPLHLELVNPKIKFMTEEGVVVVDKLTLEGNGWRRK